MYYIEIYVCRRGIGDTGLQNYGNVFFMLVKCNTLACKLHSKLQDF